MEFQSIDTQSSAAAADNGISDSSNSPSQEETIHKSSRNDIENIKVSSKKRIRKAKKDIMYKYICSNQKCPKGKKCQYSHSSLSQITSLKNDPVPKPSNSSGSEVKGKPNSSPNGSHPSIEKQKSKVKNNRGEKSTKKPRSPDIESQDVLKTEIAKKNKLIRQSHIQELIKSTKLNSNNIDFISNLRTIQSNSFIAVCPHYKIMEFQSIDTQSSAAAADNGISDSSNSPSQEETIHKSSRNDIENIKVSSKKRIRKAKKDIMYKYICSNQKCPKGKKCQYSHSSLSQITSLKNDPVPKPSNSSGSEVKGKPNSSPNGSHPSIEKQKSKVKNNRGEKSTKKPRSPDIESQDVLKTEIAKKNKLIRQSHIQELIKSTKLNSNNIEINDEEISLVVKPKPFTEDFPYKIDELRFVLVVSNNYPEMRMGNPPVEIHVSNSDIPLGVKENLESGFRNTSIELYSSINNPNSSLKYIVEWLVNNLESIINSKPASTLKFISSSSIKASQITSPQDNNSVNPAAGQRIPVQRPIPKSSSNMENLSNSQKLELIRSNELESISVMFSDSFKSSRSEEFTLVEFDLPLTDTSIKSDMYLIPIVLRFPNTYPSYKKYQVSGNLNLEKLVPSIKIDPQNVKSKKGKPSSFAKSIPEKFINVENSFLLYAAESPQISCPGLIRWLDVNFDSLLINQDSSEEQVLSKNYGLNTITENMINHEICTNDIDGASADETMSDSNTDTKFEVWP
ncbi:hypothetical protein AYI69_g1061, partial [Smittium culicis]